jgi:DENN (AEX-3) domain
MYIAIEQLLLRLEATSTVSLDENRSRVSTLASIAGLESTPRSDLHSLLHRVTCILRDELYQEFINSSEYEYLLTEMATQQLENDFMTNDYRTLLPHHVAVHAAEVHAARNKDETTSTGVGIFQSVGGKVDSSSLQSTPLSAELLDALRPYLSPPPRYYTNKSRLVLSFVFTVPSTGVEYNGCVCFSSHVTSATALSDSVIPPEILKPSKNFLARSKRAMLSLRNFSRSRSSSSSAIRPGSIDEYRSIEALETMSVSSFSESASKVDSSDLNGVFLLTSQLCNNSLRRTVAAAVAPLECENIAWCDKLSSVLECKGVKDFMHSRGEEEPDLSVLLSLGTDHLVKLILATILEHKIIITCKDASASVALAKAIQLCTEPFKWVHTYAPYLPNECLELIHSPIPFWVGIQKDSFIRHKGGFPPDSLIVDLDLDLCFSSNKHAALYSSIGDDLRYSIQQSKVDKHKDEYRFDSESYDTRLVGSKIKRDCQDFVKDLLMGTISLAYTGSASDGSIVHLLDERLFMQSNKHKSYLFMEEFLRTQGFSQWLSLTLQKTDIE